MWLPHVQPLAQKIIDIFKCMSTVCKGGTEKVQLISTRLQQTTGDSYQGDMFISNTVILRYMYAPVSDNR